MFRGMYTATTGLLNNQRKMEALSNNLSNVNTTGYKKDGVLSESFPELLLSKINDNSIDTSNKVFNGIELQQDGDVYSLKADGAYFKVDTPAGPGYSDELRFTIDEDGYLKTQYRDRDDNIKTDGENYVLGRNGRLQVTNGNLQVDEDGNILAGGQVVDSLVTIPKRNVIGTAGFGIRTDRVFTNFTQGNLIDTGNDLDLALNGDGFFKIQTEDGIKYTRDGSFKINAEGTLVTSEGYPVLGQNGAINIGQNEFFIDENGNVFIEGQLRNTLDIVTINNDEYLRKLGDNFYIMAEGIDAEEAPFEGEVLTGYLETSNVNSVEEMVNMISTMRNYESNQKVVQSYDEILGKAVNDIAKL
ncbi:flagellar hook-basal body complex protein [Clostridium sp. D2Q-14]|uniref:flagellar hook-basal body protein n=1 Tax=Anaeromonas gelatinilytica TaxID=2683194 RepID=UPI00193B028F|nr:flagellar hook-basal body protein [Anaeromonas gelatinilytica]MBS4536426.1 flagellar hook-basal body complex protein [Anaeromonas gelatinilytica]